jgi:hypothetical protein
VIYNIAELAMLVKMHAVGIVLANGPTGTMYALVSRTGLKIGTSSPRGFSLAEINHDLRNEILSKGI